MLAIEQYTRRLLKDFHPIIAANRPPVDLAPEQGDRERFVRGSGGLVTGLSGMALATGAVWVASVRDGFEGELDLGSGGEPMMVQTADGARFQVSWVNPPRLVYDLYYNTIANPLLWFVQHYLWNLAEAPVLDDSTHLAWNEGYRRVNQMFAQQVVREARRGRKRPLVLSHDYHLYLVPRLVRRELPDAVLQHFVHIPWPTPQYWKVLPSYMREEIMDGLLAADIIGLQTHSDVRNFLLTCEENMGLPVDLRQQTACYRGRTVWVRRYPISIDVREFERSAASRGLERAGRGILRWRGGAHVLSENAGTHEELGEWAITINPFDVDATAQAMQSALLMDPVERHARAEKMRAVVQQNDVARWISAQLQDIRDLVEPLAARHPEPAREETLPVGREGTL